MRKLNWPTKAEQHGYMRFRQSQNVSKSLFNSNENWMHDILASTGLKWNRQIIWGKRLFDFWNGFLGVAIEVDGEEHNLEYDAYRDEYNFRRSGIVVLRVRNRNEQDAITAVSWIGKAGSLAQRKTEIGINGNSYRKRRVLARMPYPPSFLSAYMKGEFVFPVTSVDSA
jgi:very-short-patch-repair endonuclease